MAKLPKGWKPGPTPEIKDHPSVVRHTDPVIRTSIGIGYLDGATHVRFQANPDCCDLCSKMDGTVRRINTVMNWKFLNVHPNCRCHWVPMKKEGGEFVDLPVYVTKSEKMNLVQKEVTVRRGGKTFKQMRWVRPDKGGSSNKKESPGGGSSEPKSDSDGGPDLLDAVLADLKRTESELMSLKDGEEKTISGIPAINLGDGYYGLKVHGKRVVAVGAHSSALMLQGATKLTASGAATMAGDMKGGSVAAPQAKAAKVASATKVRVQSSLAEKPKPRDDKNSKESKGKAEKGKGEG